MSPFMWTETHTQTTFSVWPQTAAATVTWETATRPTCLCQISVCLFGGKKSIRPCSVASKTPAYNPES